jgi:hypothetical protein
MVQSLDEYIIQENDSRPDSHSDAGDPCSGAVDGVERRNGTDVASKRSQRWLRNIVGAAAEGDENGKVQLSYEELALLVEGIELGRTRRKNSYRHEEYLGVENFGENAGN